VPAEKEIALKFAVTAPDSVRLRLVCCGQMFAISPNGRWLVFQGSPVSVDSTRPLAEHHQLYLRDLTDLSTRVLPGTQDAVSLSFSPNSNDFVFLVGRELKRMSLTGTEAQSVASLPEGYNGGASWGSDDTIAVNVLGQMLKVSANGGVPTPLFEGDTTGSQLTGPQRWAREQVILYSRASDTRAPQVTWRSLRTGDVKTISTGSTPVYLAARRALLFVRPDGSLMQYPFDLSTGDTTGPGVRIANGIVLRSPIVSHAEYAVSATGTLVLAMRRSNLLRGASLVTLGKTTTTTRVMPEFVGFTRPMFSPRGDKVAVLAAADSGGYSPQLLDVTRNVTTRAPVDGAVTAVGWTATGDSIIYQTTPRDFYVRAADGSGVPTPVLSIRDWTSRADGIAAWGSYIAFAGTRTGSTANVDIGVAHRDSLGAVRAYTTSAATESEPAISPDGKWLTYTSTDNGRVEVWVSAFPVPSGRYLVSTGGGRTSQWSSDSRTIFYVFRASVFSASFTPGPTPAIGAPRPLFSRDPWGAAVVSPSGTQMLFSDRAREGITQALVVQLHAFDAK
jgi:Tol biopolymer transport system component